MKALCPLTETVNADVVVVPRGTVKGHVLNNSGTTPIDNASVLIYVIGTVGYSFSTTTGPDGAFMFAGVPSGEYYVEAENPANRLTGYANGAITYENEVSEAMIRIAPTGSIEGTVFLPDGVTPALNAFVSVYGLGQVQASQTDGSFRYTDLAAGPGMTYTLTASEFATHRAGMTTVSVTSDGETANGNIVLHGVGIVRGTVFDGNGVTQMPGLPVTIVAQGLDSMTHNMDNRFTGPDGTFEFTDVPVGTFTVETVDAARGIGDSVSGTMPGEDEIVTADLVLAAVASVTGKVYKANGITPAAGGGARYTGCERTYQTTIDSQGRFLLSNVLVPCSSFTVYLEDAEGIGIGYAYGSLSTSDGGKTIDIGSVVLDDKPIAVASVTPVNGTVNVSVNTMVRIVFSEPVKPETVTSSTIFIKAGATVLSAELILDSDGAGVTLLPSETLNGMTLYTVYITTDLTDRAGKALHQTITSAFTTADDIAPTVASVSPADAATEAAQNSAVRITFSESIDPVSASGTKLLNGDVVVNTRLDLVQANTIAILTPLSALTADTIYTVSVNNVKDLAGNAILDTFTSTFKTIDTSAPIVSSMTSTGDLIRGNTVIITAEADEDAATIDFFVDGVLASTDNTIPFNYSMLLSKAGTVTGEGRGTGPGRKQKSECAVGQRAIAERSH